MAVETLHEPGAEVVREPVATLHAATGAHTPPPAGDLRGSVPGDMRGDVPAGGRHDEDVAGAADAMLSVAFRHVGSVCILSVRGALTAETLAVFESQIDRLGRTTCQRVVIDAAGLTEMDDTGVAVLTGLHHYVQARGGRLSVTGAGGGVSRLLASTPLLAG